ncbi:type II toxin-antitoxin system RelE/ParE family toxin [Methylobacterium sp. J-076]|uniref:type II toxin-antitoxin system RelE/ParE family toxin n=1 Tax=Methylobacterium sp. J-076 TaxID=2836655 RepID=UPI001FBA7B68|nr:type II toxin-antitoxin system RelE/ParE family toxin [Methylobacterium sp. J-076]MCJ2012385.1 type II toxin-antitoxin system RelE/ParE family toxin [Methylobacterium sp. J-076]
MKRRQILYTAEAATDLDAIYDLIAEGSDPRVAVRYEQRIRTFCDALEYGAERGSLRDDVRPGLRIIGLERRVTVAFTVEGERVVILRIFYRGRDWGSALR